MAETFSFRFDFWDDEHCKGYTEMIREDLPLGWSNIVGEYPTAPDLNDALEALLQLAEDSDLDFTFDSDVIEGFEEARRRVKYCVDGACECASIAWDADKTVLDDDLLANLPGSGPWVLFERQWGGEEVFCELRNDAITLDTILTATRDRDGFHQIEVTFDGTEVKFSWSGMNARGGEVFVKMLTALHEDAVYRWTEDDEVDEESASWSVFSFSERLLQVAVAYHEHGDHDDMAADEFEEPNFSEILAALHDAGFNELPTDDQMAIVALADTWHDTIATLVKTARLVHAA